MATLRETKQRIISIKNTSKITQAMRMVAAAKLRRAQDAITAARPFADQLQKILSNLASAETDFVHPYFEARETVSNVMVVIVTSDRGLCGGFNTNILRATRDRLDTIKAEHPEGDHQVGQAESFAGQVSIILQALFHQIEELLCAGTTTLD